MISICFKVCSVLSLFHSEGESGGSNENSYSESDEFCSDILIIESFMMSLLKSGGRSVEVLSGVSSCESRLCGLDESSDSFSESELNLYGWLSISSRSGSSTNEDVLEFFLLGPRSSWSSSVDKLFE